MVSQFLIPVIEAQKKRGDYVCVCGSGDSDVQKLRDIGIDVFTHRLKRRLNPFNMVKEIFRIKRVLIEQKIDVVVCHSPIGAGVGRMAARLAKTPNVIYFAHGLPCAPGQNILIWLFWFCIEKALGKITDAMLVMNNYDERLCKTHHLIKDTNKIFRISGMGVDLKKFKHETDDYERRQIRKELGIPEDKKIVLCVAYLIQEKGVFILLAAAEKICAQRNDIYFLLAGSGPSADKLKQKVKIAHMEDNFKLLGWRDDIDRLTRVADIFVLPTYYFEGLPVAILEAMACGKPVIATQHRGGEDIVVDGQTGFLVPIKQVDPLVEKIWCLLHDEQLRMRMGRAGRQQVELHFEISYCTKEIVETLEKARGK
jgi:glycosyltransferase EpsD